MKKKNIIILVLILVILACIISLYLLNLNNKAEGTPLKITVNSSDLITRSVEGYNSVEVYEQDHLLIINTMSETAFYDETQFTVAINEKISATDVQVIWTTIGGNTEETTDNARIIAEIKIQEAGVLIFDKKINFAKKAFEAVEDVLEKNMK